MSTHRTHKKQSNNWIILMIVLILLAVAGAGGALYYQYKHSQHIGNPQTLEQVEYLNKSEEEYDVIVVGTDPEGITAAVSAARNGQKTLLVDGNDREVLGGLLTVGWLNSLDMNFSPNSGGILNKPVPLNKGLFSEWYDRVEGDSFDVTTAANVFYDLVKKEKNIDLMLKMKEIKPKMTKGANGNDVIEGIVVTKADGSQQTIKAKSVIDATQDADIAVAAGVPYTYGREDLSDKNTKMAVTLVFRLKNITPDVWAKVKDRLQNDKDEGTGANDVSAWGYKEMYDYKSSNPKRVVMRGLNIGRQNDETMLINALQIYGIDGADTASRAEAFEIGKKEIPLVVEHMKKIYPEFANIELDATAPELYVRETRHIEGEYRLHILDVLENRDHWDRIGFGSYEVDIQRSYAGDGGAVVADPEQYAVPFRSIVPKKIDGLLVVGRSSSFDTLPHGSSRTVPVGMATGQSAGVAAKLATDNKVTFREMSQNKELIAKLQEMINQQGMDVKPFSIKPYPFMEHKQYEGLKVAVTYGLAYGSYGNTAFNLDNNSNPVRFINLLYGAKKMKPDAFTGDPGAALSYTKGATADQLTAERKEHAAKDLTLDQACYTVALALGIKVEAPADAKAELVKQGILTEASLQTITNPAKLTDGDSFMLIKDLHDRLVGTKL
ncbi:FAD-dependent oxidoreductase [Paenibacillus sp. N1-5-1-14]|uniref:FAD-dependent oxidoreductase n=1 Tax=Paenibacillus radicibacter TaxID=2972488 RepID=UPI0021590831|nr:FAD-dependent oxidoreductase [Paenibacillus radicibacter]MCR8644098.1 FAD-dependent oxidoreductase [Paenibacillus radicibacter]